MPCTVYRALKYHTPPKLLMEQSNRCHNGEFQKTRVTDRVLARSLPKKVEAKSKGTMRRHSF